ncbi:MAG: hypothetical protein ICV73_27980 [Acetobacteraceae bacterium]|nr:hypothetical protein [Acetobacteraceae bacterium]
MDGAGRTVVFLLGGTRDATAAQLFFARALGREGRNHPPVRAGSRGAGVGSGREKVGASHHGPGPAAAARARPLRAGERHRRARPGHRLRHVPRGSLGRRGPHRPPALRLAAGPGVRHPGQRRHAPRGAPAPEALRAAPRGDERRARPCPRRGAAPGAGGDDTS